MKSVGRNQTRARHPIQPLRVVLPLLRLALFLAAVGFAGFSLVLRSVHADVAESLWGLGAEIMQFPGAPQEGVRRLSLNGAQLSFRTQTVDAALGDVLAHYEALCANRDAQINEQLATVLDSHSSARVSRGLLRAITTRAWRNEDAGYVACLDMGDEPRDLGMLVNRLHTWSHSGQLRDLGEPRYILARRVKDQTGEKTFLLTMWADSGLLLDRMLPRAGADAAGSDPDGVPRPPRSQRILSASEVGQASSVFIYRVVTESHAELESFYRRKLSVGGWSIVERNPVESIEIDGIGMLSAEKGHRLVTVLYRVSASSPSILTILTSEPT
ncbi:MAG: hypothetical protein WCE62_21240 [Polyangiales bacterium]